MNANDPFFEQMYEAVIHDVDEAIISIKHRQNLMEVEMLLQDEWDKT
jgi:hypothetical protein